MLFGINLSHIVNFLPVAGTFPSVYAGCIEGFI